MKSKLFSIVLLFALALSSGTTGPARAAGLSQENTPAGEMLANMTPEEVIGQLFLVTFSGTTADEKSQIYDLIANHHIGGVVLQASNDNFVAAPDTVTKAHELIDQLQTEEWQSSQNLPGAPATGQPASMNYLPLFIGIEQDGDGYPNDQILSGLTQLPDPMAIGATWNTDLAQQVGTVAGQELSALGFNLLFGPSLDVLDSPEATAGNGLAADAFGGDPYWVGAMGQAYISGLHTGSDGRLAVVAYHFPGMGSSDRPTGEEPATVRKSLEQLKQIELAPFFAVTGNAPSASAQADGLLVSHIRYQGLQGNIRATTKPVSFDPKALSQILSLPQFTTWRQNGGLMVSDDLGSQTVRRFYDPTGQSFVAYQVALDAFLAGNDLLYLGNIQSSDAPDNYTTVLKILDFFVQKYNNDPAFKQSVDNSVVRILATKYRLYNNFYISNVVSSTLNLDAIGQSQSVTFDVARQSATLVSPDVADLDTVLPSPPSSRDRIVFLTDTRIGKQCSNCPEEPMLAVDAVQNAVLRLYGPATSGQVSGNRLISYTFNDMAALLKGGGSNQNAVSDLSLAQWIVINMLDAEPGEPQTIALHNFLSERQDLFRGKKVIVFSFNAPYYLDATDISKLTAYYCLYSKSAPFVEVAARLLFQELTPAGSLPVSVAGYDLFSATLPDPKQVIQLSLELPSAATATPNETTPEPTTTPTFKVGDTVSIRTGVILDSNQHQVPDGTGVRFTVSSSGEGATIQVLDSVTTQGVARVAFSIPRAGLLEIRATSDPATSSVVLQVNASSEGLSVTVISPTTVAVATPTLEAVATPAPNNPPPGRETPGFVGWLLMLICLSGLSYLAYWIGRQTSSARWAVRWSVCTALGGLFAYNYLVLQMPGAVALMHGSGFLGIMGVVIAGGTMGFGAGYGWERIFNGSTKQSG